MKCSISNIVDSNLENIAFIFLVYQSMFIYGFLSYFSLIWGNFLHDSTNKIYIPYMNDNVDHCLHHYYGQKNCNFSYYFNYCDKIFGTYKKLEIKTDEIVKHNKIETKM